MTVAGMPVDLTGFEPLELIPPIEAQIYLQKLAPILAISDGQTLFFVHDGKTGTSHELFVNAANSLEDRGNLQDSKLSSLLKLLCDESHVLRIWYAGDNPNCHTELEDCSTFEETILILDRQLKSGSDIGLRYSPK